MGFWLCFGSLRYLVFYSGWKSVRFVRLDGDVEFVGVSWVGFD